MSDRKPVVREVPVDFPEIWEICGGADPRRTIVIEDFPVIVEIDKGDE